MPVKYIPYFPDTVEGQAILNNFIRTRRALKYRDDNNVYTKIKRGMPYYEVETTESVGNNPKNMLIRGECISACAYLKEKGIKVDLVSVDPPFASGADYAKKVYIRKNPKVAQTIKKAEEELAIDDLKAFEEKMYGDIWNKESYLNWMYENLMAIKSVMSETASIYVHLDWHIGHYVKVLMDEVFGENNFRNEIIWQKTTAPKAQSGQFSNVHDTIFYYSMNENYKFNKLYTDYSDEYLKDFYKYKTDDGRIYRISDFSQNGQGQALYFGEDGKSILLEPQSGKHWIWGQEKITKGVKEGRIILSKNNAPGLIRFLDEMPGNPLRDIWTDLNAIGPGASENADYATQKPETLIERIIKSSSDEDMTVADFFGGSGVTAKVANSQKRNFIHVDIGLNSIQTARDGLKEIGGEFDILEIKDGVNLFRNPIQTMDKLKQMILGLKNEDALDKFWEGAIQDSKLGTIPVYIPNLLDHTTKVLDIPLMNRVINEAIPDLPDGVKKVIVYYIDIDDKKEIEKFIHEQLSQSQLQIELHDLKEILSDVVVDDVVVFEIKEAEGVYEIEFTKFISDRLRQKIDEYNQKGMMQPLSEPNENGDDENGDSENGNDENGYEVEEENGNGKKKKKFSPIDISEYGLELIELISLDCKNTEGIWHSDREIKIDKLGFVIKDGTKTKQFWDGKISSNKKPKRLKIRNISGDETIKAIN